MEEGNKKIIILAVIIFLILIAGIVYFLFKNKTNNQGNLNNNVSKENKVLTVKERCLSFCSAKNKNAYCSLPIKEFGKTCNELSKTNEAGVEKCAVIDCSKKVDKSCVSGLNGEWVEPRLDGKCRQKPGKVIFKLSPTDQPPKPGEICCSR